MHSAPQIICMGDCVARMQSVQGGGRNTPVSSVI
jgi:hypothetical protein